MESKINIASVEEYSKKFAGKVSEDFFSNNKVITGHQILDLCNIHQINLFIIRELFLRWQEETRKLKSPYFDYENQEVRQALNEFMNVLSEHIAVKKEDFGPLLEEAVKNAILLIFTPYDYYSLEIEKSRKSHNLLEDFKNLAKYVQINKGLLNAFINRFQQEGEGNIDRERAYQIFNEVFEEIKEGPEDVNPYIEKLSRVEPFDPQLVHSENPEAAGSAGQRSTSDSDKEVKSNNGDSRNVQYGQQKATLNEQFNASTLSSTLSNIHKKHKIENLRNNMGINQRYMFIKELFGNDLQEFHNTINDLEKCDSYNDAFGILKNGPAKRYNWDMESEEVEEFLELLAKRYN